MIALYAVHRLAGLIYNIRKVIPMDLILYDKWIILATPGGVAGFSVDYAEIAVNPDSV